MPFRGSGNFEQHYTKCPKCEKKGLYQISLIVGKATAEYMKRCRECDYKTEVKRVELA